MPELRNIVDRPALTPHLAHLFNSAETGYEKPHPRGFEIVLTAFPEAKEVWMIGDGWEADVIGAATIGIRTTLVHTQARRAKRPCPRLSQVEAAIREDP